MATYKVPQDVEAEDTILGPFTLKQFIFLIIAAVTAFLTFQLAKINIALIIFTVPIVLIFAILGVYRRPDQNIEVYLQALLRFHLKPRKRLWSQDGTFEHVKITVPPTIEHSYTDGLDQRQVRSQLSQLATVIDTRGWSSKNASIQMPAYPVQPSDRIVQPGDLPNTIQPTEVHSADDMMDVQNNPVAAQFEQRVQAMPQQIRSDAQAYMQEAAQTPILPIAQTPQNTTQQTANAMPYGEQAFTPYPQNMEQTAPVYTQQPVAQNQNTSTMTTASSPDIIRLAHNSDLNLTAISHQAEQALQNNEEVSFH